MGYLQELQQELRALLGDDMDEEQQQKIARFVGEKILESYKNGIATGQPTGADKEAKRQTSRFARGK